MAHTHDHDPSTYYMEQLCTIGICGALGGVAVMMWYQRLPLDILLKKFFHPYVLCSGIALIVLVLIRAVALWVAVGKVKAAHEHDHCHDHEHDHDGHDHCHSHGHDHNHDHGHGHGHDPVHCHSHDHTHAESITEKPELASADNGHDHDHGWNPWRYAVLLLPITLFFLNMPSQGFTAGYLDRQGRRGDLADSSIIEMPHKGNEVINLQFQELEQGAYREDVREVMEGQIGRLKGQFVPGAGSREFTLMRLKMACCAADAIPLRVKILSPDPIAHIQPQQWVEVTGQIQFRKLKGRDEFVPVLQLESAGSVVETEPDPDIYIQ
jgi:hypothetical protein